MKDAPSACVCFSSMGLTAEKVWAAPSSSCISRQRRGKHHEVKEVPFIGLKSYKK